jgi:outer membrane lipoprotein-sorting protein
MNPGKLHIKFSNPSGRTIVSNGRTLWVYSPSSNIVGVQELGQGGSGGIASFTNGYMALLTDQGANGYTLKLKHDSRHYQEIILVLDSTFFLKRALFKTKDGSAYSFTISNVSSTATVLPGLFNFEVPANAQRVNNPLNIQ